MKIAIIGNPGSGKSTLSLQLHKIFCLPLYHLDQYFWKLGWREPERGEFDKIHNDLCDKDRWIIEGCATRLFAYRANKADIIIFLDMPTYLCLYRVIKRALLGYGTIRATSAPGCPERLPTFKFLKFVAMFNRTRKPAIEDLIKKYSHEKRTVILCNNDEVKNFLDVLKAEYMSTDSLKK